MVEHFQIKNSNDTTYQHILVEGRSTFSSLLPDKLTQAPPLGDSPYCRKKTACLQCQNCSHFSCRTVASQGPHRAPKCTLQKVNSNWIRDTNMNKHWRKPRLKCAVYFKWTMWYLCVYCFVFLSSTQICILLYKCCMSALRGGERWWD